MVSRHLRSRSIKKRSVRVPGGKSKVHYGAGRLKKHSCGRCGSELHGTPNAIRSEVRSMRKTERVPERPYAGVLCGECLEDLMRYKTKFEVKFKYPEFSEMDFKRDLTIEKFLPAGWWQEINPVKKTPREMEAEEKEKAAEVKEELVKAVEEKEEAEKEEAEAEEETVSEEKKKPRKKRAKKEKTEEEASGE